MKFKNIKKKSPPAGGKKVKSPSNSRTIPASVKTSTGKAERFKFSLPKINHAALLKVYRRALKIFVIFIFIVAVIVVGYDFKNNLQIKQGIDSQREVLSHDLKFWEDFLSKHQNYSNAYFQASILKYKLGETSKAKAYIDRGLSLDPNSQNGRKIEEFLNK